MTKMLSPASGTLWDPRLMGDISGMEPPDSHPSHTGDHSPAFLVWCNKHQPRESQDLGSVQPLLCRVLAV